MYGGERQVLSLDNAFVAVLQAAFTWRDAGVLAPDVVGETGSPTTDARFQNSGVLLRVQPTGSGE